MAVIAKQRYKLDIAPKGGWVIVYASQHDDGAREIEFEITNQGRAFSIPASINVSVQGIKSNGSYFSHSCSYSGNIVTMALADDMTDIIGKSICVLKFTNSSQQKLATTKFVLNVDTDSSSEGIIIDTEAEEIFNQMLNDIRAQAASISADIAELQSMVGSPLVASTASVMTDHNKIYVYTGSESGYTNGNWYYWNGSAWTSGGVYNSVAFETDTTLTKSGQAADAKKTGDEITSLKEDLETNFHINGNVKPNLIVGSFVNVTNNSIGASSNFSMTEPIAVKKGQKITLTARGYNTDVGMIATCNADNTSRTTVVKSIDSNEHEYIYQVLKDGYVVCSFNHNYNHKISLSIDYYAELEDVKTSVETIENSLDFVYEGTEKIELSVYEKGYVYAENNKYVSGGNFNTTNSVHLFEGQTINLTAEGYKNDVGMINLYDSANDTYKTVVRSANGVTEYSYTATEECDVRMCYRIITGASANIVTNDDKSIRLQRIESDISELKEKSLDLEKVEYPQMFTNIICIGDSLTRGESGGSQSVQLATNYPFYFSKLTGATCYNGGLSGRTTKQWWDEFGSTITGFANYDCAIIFLGTNGGLTDTVSTDCKTDYTQNADTNTGCYGKIIGKIKADAPNCKIFCVAGVNDYIRRATKMNPAVRALAEFYSVGLIDVENCIMSDSGGDDTVERYLYRPIDGIHYNRLGYMTLANMIYDAMSDYMSKHRDMYE